MSLYFSCFMVFQHIGRVKVKEEIPLIQQNELNLAGELGAKESLVFVARDHPNEALESMRRMREEGRLRDIVLRVQGRKIYAHRLVLAASSQYFRSMFAGDMLESRSTEVELKEVEADAIELLVDFAYTTRLEITVTNVQSLMTAASLFDFPAVFKATAQFLMNQLHPSNCLGIRSFAKTYGSDALVNAASRYFRNHFIDAVKNEEFLMLSTEVLADLIDSDDVNVRSEEDVFRAVENWLKHRPEERKDSLPLLLKHVRLPILSPGFLKQYVEPNPYIKMNLECRDLVDEAKNFHLFPGDYCLTKSSRLQPRKSTVGILFAIGGRGAVGEPFCSVECFDFRTNNWYEGPELK